MAFGSGDTAVIQFGTAPTRSAHIAARCVFQAALLSSPMVVEVLGTAPLLRKDWCVELRFARLCGGNRRPESLRHVYWVPKKPDSSTRPLLTGREGTVWEGLYKHLSANSDCYEGIGAVVT